MRFFSKSVNAINVGILVMALFSAGTGHARTFDRVVAKVNDEIITQSAVRERMNAELVRLKGMPQSQLPPRDQMMSMVLKRMVDEKLQLQDAKKLGVSVDDESVMKALNDIKKNNNIDDYAFNALLEKEATTLEEYKETIRKQIMVSKIVGYQVRNRIKISDADVAKFYKAHRKEFRNPPQVHARHILFIFDDKTTGDQRKKKEDTARQVLEKIKAGEDFIELAKKYSEDVSAANGGDLGFLEKGKMVPEFENAVFSLKQGQVSDLVRTPYGIHIIKVDDVKVRGYKPLEEIRPQIENQLYAERQAKVYENYMKDLRKAAFIEISMDEGKAKNNNATKPRREAKRSVERPNRSRVSKAKVRPDNSKTLKRNRASERKHEVASNILPPLTIKVPGKTTAPAQVSSSSQNSMEALEKKLLHIKKLRDEGKISSAEYLKKKRELLKNL